MSLYHANIEFMLIMYERPFIFERFKMHLHSIYTQIKSSRLVCYDINSSQSTTNLMFKIDYRKLFKFFFSR